MQIDAAMIDVTAYLDDVVLSLPPGLVQFGFDQAQAKLAEIGLLLNVAKTRLWAPITPPPPALQFAWSASGVSVVGGMLTVEEEPWPDEADETVAILGTDEYVGEQ
eukprot:7053113-Prorocentrum_lima.AAC.1